MRLPYALIALVLGITSTAQAHQARQCPTSRGPIRRVDSIGNWQPTTTPTPEATKPSCTAEHDKPSRLCIKQSTTRADSQQKSQAKGDNRRVVLWRQLRPESALYYLGWRAAAPWLERYEQLQAAAFMAVHRHNVRVAATRGNGLKLKRGNYRVVVPKKFIMAVM